MANFGSRLAGVIADRGVLCLGIDPHPFLLADWGLTDDASGVRELGLRAIEAATGVAGIVKPQIAFFERHGAAGYAALEEVLAAARAADLLVIADVKRGDVGSTVAAYAEAWLTPGTSLEVDAMTVVAYQGIGSLTDPMAVAARNDKGVFVLAATSNPEALATQAARVGLGEFSGRSVAGAIVEGVRQANSGASLLGNIGVVLGATVELKSFGIELDSLSRTPILAPGFGEQGAQPDDIVRLFGSAAGNVVANVGRSALRTGPAGLRDELRRLGREFAGARAS